MANTLPVDVNTDINTGSDLNFSNLVPQILSKFVAVLEGALIIAVGVILIRYVRKYLQKIQITHEQQRTALNLLEKITSGFIIVISITLALKVVGIDMTLLISVAILGLSYGLQDIIKNYVAGILILFKAPFKIGDIVKIRDFTGKVAKMDFQSTSLETFDNRHITIYNSDVMTQSIVNFSNNTVRRTDFDVTIGYGSDIPKAIQIFQKILDNIPTILKNPKASIIFKKFTEQGAMFTLKFWLQMPCNTLKIKTDIATQIGQAFDEQNIFMPYSKDIQVENENELSLISESHKNRVNTFYQLPLFAAETVSGNTSIDPSTQNLAPEQISFQNALSAFAEEEPE